MKEATHKTLTAALKAGVPAGERRIEYVAEQLRELLP